MKVLITTDWYAPVINGVVTSVMNLKSGLEKDGHDVRILTLSSCHKSYKNGDVYYISSFGIGGIYPSARIAPILNHAFIKELIDWNPDIIHSQCEFSTFHFARKISSRCNAPIVHTYHTVYEDYTRYFFPNERVGKFMASVFSKYIASMCDYLIAPTDKTKSLLVRYGVETPIAVIGSGLDLEKYRKEPSSDEIIKKKRELGFNDDDRILVYVGRLAYEKNVEELIRLVCEYPRENVKLLIVGDGPNRKDLEHIANPERVVFTGMVAPSDVSFYYHLGEIFVNASQSEAQGLSYIEAMASNLAVICKSDECLNKIISDGVNGYTYRSDDEFFSKLTTLLDNPSLEKEFGKRGRELIEERFSIRAFVSAVESIYLKCMFSKGIEKVG